MVRVRTERCHGPTSFTVVLAGRGRSWPFAHLAMKPSNALAGLKRQQSGKSHRESRYLYATELTASHDIMQDRPYMQEFLQQIDLDYYRFALLRVTRAELERLRQERSAGTDVERRNNFPFDASPAAEGAASPEGACPPTHYGDPDAVHGK